MLIIPNLEDADLLPIYRDTTDPFIQDVSFSSAVSKMNNMPVAFPKQQPRLDSRPVVQGFPAIWAEV